MKHLQLTDSARAVLTRSTITASSLVLPDEKLDRDTYQAVDTVLRQLGGKWKRSANAHLFASAPRQQLQALVACEKVVHQKKTLQQFSPPAKAADYLLGLVE